RPDPAGDDRDIGPVRRADPGVTGPDREGPGADAAGHRGARSRPRSVRCRRVLPDAQPDLTDAREPRSDEALLRGPEVPASAGEPDRIDRADGGGPPRSEASGELRRRGAGGHDPNDR